MSREYKHYELRATKKPAKNAVLSTTVAVYRGKDRYYCYVSFSEKLVHYVGKRLPLGVSKDHPAYLSVVVEGNEVFVSARYVSGYPYPTYLWQSKTIPAWLNFYTPKVEDNGNNPEKKAPAKRRARSEAGDPHRSGQASGHGGETQGHRRGESSAGKTHRRAR